MNEISISVITCVVTPKINCPNKERYAECTENPFGNFLCCFNCLKLIAKPNKKGELACETKCNRCKTLNER